MCLLGRKGGREGALKRRSGVFRVHHIILRWAKRKTKTHRIGIRVGVDLSARVHARQGRDNMAQPVTCGGRREKFKLKIIIYLLIIIIIFFKLCMHVVLCLPVRVARLGARLGSAIVGPSVSGPTTSIFHFYYVTNLFILFYFFIWVKQNSLSL